jgi:plasmid maintenance system antidote protein VapI
LEKFSGNRDGQWNTAVRLSRFFGTSASFWLGLQADYDAGETENSESESLSAIHKWSLNSTHA